MIPITVHEPMHGLIAQAKYEEALRVAPESAKKQRAVYHANLAACHLRTKHFEDAVQDSTAALELEPEYVKVHRATLPIAPSPLHLASKR